MGPKLPPATLESNVYFTAADATVSRAIAITNGTPGPGGKPFDFDNTSFQLNTINKTVMLDDIEKWTVTNNNVFGHTFHIHDVEFKIVARNGSAAGVGSHESGWKDVMYVPRSENVTFVARFNDYADEVHPFMYHCHFSNHEDGGMMGQFVVKGSSAGVKSRGSNLAACVVMPNPTADRLFVKFQQAEAKVYYVTVVDALGRAKLMLPRPNMETGIDVSALSPGNYFVHVMEEASKAVHVVQFVKL